METNAFTIDGPERTNLNMRSEEWEKVKEVLRAALETDASERQSFLDAQDISAAVREEVASLLQFEGEAGRLMDISAAEFAKDLIDGEPPADTLLGTAVGVYRVVSELGLGGMGAVYLAERTDGKFEQKVALKLLKREMNTDAVRRRFHQERKILAALEHPNIARLLDAGTTEDNIPYLAMEYVEGPPIDVYCRENGLGLDECLDLFREVCEAVGYAHRNLIVHRDLKPSNILVTESGSPKLLDFGISKILSPDAEIAGASTVTRFGAMTPSYASPEQLRNTSVNTATDIYSLGVILYELLSGRRPFADFEIDLKSIYNAVLETDPAPPSSAAGTYERSTEDNTVRIPGSVAEIGPPDADKGATRAGIARHTARPRTRMNPQQLRGDLDNIVLKALRKEPERRYSSAENFAEDIHRYQRGLPVTARPNTFSYRAGKFIKRNSVSVFALGLVVLALIGGGSAAVWQAGVANAEREKADKRFAQVRTLANSYLFDVYPEMEKLEGSLAAREIILKNALQYLDSLYEESSGDLELQRELATAYEKVGDVQGAINTQSNADINAGLESYRKAQKLREEVFAAMPDDPDVKEELAQNYYITAKTLWWANDTPGAEELFEKAVKLRRELVAADPASQKLQDRLAVVLIDYAAVPAFNAQSEKARPLFEEARSILDRLMQQYPENDQFKKTYARLLRSYSQDKSHTGEYDAALADLRTAAEITAGLIAKSPDDYPLRRTMWITDFRTCEVYIQMADGANAVDACVKAIKFNEEVHQKEPEEASAANDLAVSYFNAARAHRLAGNPAGSITYANKAIGVMTELHQAAPTAIDYLRSIAIYESEIADNYLTLGDYGKALTYLQKTQEKLERAVKTDPETATFQYDLSKALRLAAAAHNKLGAKAKAVESADRALVIVRELKQKNALRSADENLIAEIEAEKTEYSK